MREMYRRAAEAYAKRIHEVFESETKLKELFHSYFPGLEFSRTDHWASLLRMELNKIWLVYGPPVKSNPTQFDVLEILWELQNYLDYNLFSQVLLNMQSWVGWGYSVPDAKKELETLQKKYGAKEGRSPFVKGAKMVQILTPEDNEHNLDLSSVKALKIISDFSPMNSFRVSPKGGTPALADSRNLSLLGMGSDRYVCTLLDLKTYYVTWEQHGAPRMIEETTTPGTFMTKGIDYPFVSKSGGETLNEVLFARLIATYFYKACRPQIVLPRLNSVVIVAYDAANVHLAFLQLTENERFQGLNPVLEFHEGTRFKEECSA